MKDNVTRAQNELYYSHLKYLTSRQKDILIEKSVSASIVDSSRIIETAIIKGLINPDDSTLSIKEIIKELLKVEESMRESSDRLKIDSLEYRYQETYFNFLMTDYENDIEGYINLFWLGLLASTFGYFGWLYLEYRNESISKLRIIKAERQYTDCQSCSTELQYSEIDQHKMYCSHCHNGYSFINPNLTCSEISQQIRLKMIKDGLSESQINKQLKKLKSLYRWKKTFKW